MTKNHCIKADNDFDSVENLVITTKTMAENNSITAKNNVIIAGNRGITVENYVKTVANTGLRNVIWNSR